MVADDDPDIQALLADLISDARSVELVGAVGNADEAIALAVRESPDVALIDVRMPGDGLVAALGIRRRAPGTRVVALSSEDDRRTVVAMLEAGAVGYLVKDARGHTIIESIRRAASGEASLAGAVTAGIIEELLERRADQRRADHGHRETLARIQRAVEHPSALTIHLQAICSLREGTVVGFEALSRFDDASIPSPERWFADAEEVGLGTRLELLAVERALALVPALPPGAYLAVNASPTTASSQEFARLIERTEASRIVVEITESARIDDYEGFGASLRRVRDRGVRLAVDDAGAGFASLRHILNLVPDLIKLDATLIAGIASDRARQALAAGLISFADHLGASIVAEGIESAGQLAVLRELAAEQGQGYLLGRPQPPAATLAADSLEGIERRLREPCGMLN